MGATYLNKVLQLFNDGEAFSTHIALVGRKHTARLQAGGYEEEEEEEEEEVDGGGDV